MRTCQSIEILVMTGVANHLDMAHTFMNRFLEDNVSGVNDGRVIDCVNSSFALTMNGLLKGGRWEDATALLRRFKSRYKDPETSLHPNTTSMNAMLQYLSSVPPIRTENTGNGATAAAQVLESMIRAEDDGRIHLAPNRVTYNTVIHAFAKIGDHPSVHNVLHRMMDRFTSNKSTISPNAVSTNGLLHACVKSAGTFSRTPFEASKATENAFAWIADLAESGTFPDVRIDNFSYASVINSYATVAKEARREQEKTDAMNRVSFFVRQMIKASEDGHDVEPDVVTLTSAMDTMTGHPEGPERATAMFEWMQQASRDNPNSKVRPTVMTYNVLMHVWARSNRPDAGEKAYGLLQQLKKEEIEREQNEPDGSNNKDNSKNTMRDSDTRAFRATLRSYNTVLNAFSRSGTSEEALKLFEEMEKTGRLITPDQVTINSILNCLACAGTDVAVSLVTEADVIFSKAQQRGLVNTITCNTMMKIISRHNGDGPSTIDRMVSLLRMMETSPSPKQQPDTLSYMYNMLAIRRDTQGRGWDDQNPVEVGQTSDSALMRPSPQGSVLEDNEESFRQIHGLFARLMERHKFGKPKCLPNSVTMSIVLDACSMSRDPDIILDIVDDIVTLLETAQGINHKYSTYLAALEAVKHAYNLTSGIDPIRWPGGDSVPSIMDLSALSVQDEASFRDLLGRMRRLAFSRKFLHGRIKWELDSALGTDKGTETSQ